MTKNIYILHIYQTVMNGCSAMGGGGGGGGVCVCVQHSVMTSSRSLCSPPAPLLPIYDAVCCIKSVIG